MTNNHLIETMDQHGINSRTLADKMGVSLGAVRKWRTGKRPISKAMEKLIVSILEGEQLITGGSK